MTSNENEISSEKFKNTDAITFNLSKTFSFVCLFVVYMVTIHIFVYIYIDVTSTLTLESHKQLVIYLCKHESMLMLLLPLVLCRLSIHLTLFVRRSICSCLRTLIFNLFTDFNHISNHFTSNFPSE